VKLPGPTRSWTAQKLGPRRRPLLAKLPLMLEWRPRYRHGQIWRRTNIVLPTGLRSVVEPCGVRFVFVILFCIASWPAGATSSVDESIFLSLTPTQFAAVRTIEAFRKRLSEKTSENFEIFVDYMELARFPGQAHIDRTVRFLAGKYAEAPRDLLITLGRAAVPFMQQYRDLLTPQVPIIIAARRPDCPTYRVRDRKLVCLLPGAQSAGYRRDPAV
jgi:hypothetical protein